MITLVPNYYSHFKCIADKCRNSCCIGWDICIDDDSLERFKRDNIQHISPGSPARFELKDDLRCPYLNESNLCDLILKHGEDYLCQICTDHPRFRNYWSDVTEIGLGLVCEEAARIILFSDTPLTLHPIDGSFSPSMLPEDEQYLWTVRQQLLQQASSIDDSLTARLYEYFIFRHIADALYDDRLEARIRFVQYCVNEVVSRWDESEDQSDEALIDIARSFSFDCEYNEENKEKLISDFE